MDTALKYDLLSVAEYLEGEELSEVKHEYIGGVLFAMAGATRDHNRIAGSIFAELRNRLKGGRCEPFFGDVKVRMMSLNQEIFYYPDVMVACDPRDKDPKFVRFPTVILEIISESTERTDRGEKFTNYTQIESLQEYILVAQERAEVTIFRRSNGWQAEVLRSRSDEMRLASIEFSMTLAEIYEGVTFAR